MYHRLFVYAKKGDLIWSLKSHWPVKCKQFYLLRHALLTVKRRLSQLNATIGEKSEKNKTPYLRYVTEGEDHLL